MAKHEKNTHEKHGVGQEKHEKHGVGHEKSAEHIKQDKHHEKKHQDLNKENKIGKGENNWK